MALTAEQRSVLRRALGAADRFGASPRERKALVEALSVESNFRDLNYGDRDSSGALQQRPSQGWGPAGESVETDVTQFLRAARKAGGGGSAGSLAQRVQRSGFPDRYDQHSAEADQLLRGSGGGGVNPQAQTSRTTVPGKSYQADRNAAVLQWYANRKMPGGTAALAQALTAIPQDRAAHTVSSPSRPPSGPSKTTGGGGLGPLFELFWQGAGGIDAKNGVKVPQGFVSGHTDHVHVASGPKTVVRLGQLAQQMGLTVGENPAFGTVHQVHAPNSYHYKNEAIDVSGDPALMRHFAAVVAHKYGLKVNG